MEIDLDIARFFVSSIYKLLATFPDVAVSTGRSFALVAILLTIEILAIGWIESSLRRLFVAGRTALTDVVSAFLTLTNISLYVGILLFFGVLYFFQVKLRAEFDFNLLGQISDPVIAYCIYIVILDFSNYWIHRLSHQLPALWEIHKYHHSATEMTMFTALRDHPMERALAHFINGSIACLIGIPPHQYLAAHFLLQALGFLKHSNFRSDWGWLGLWVIQSPLAHRIHHGIESQYHNSNYASIFQFWDVLFGTSYKPWVAKGLAIEMGVEGGGGRSVFEEIYVCMISFYKALTRELGLGGQSILRRIGLRK